MSDSFGLPWEYRTRMRIKPRPRLTAKIEVVVHTLGGATLYEVGDVYWELEPTGWVRCSGCNGVIAVVDLGVRTELKHGCGPMQADLKRMQADDD